LAVPDLKKKLGSCKAYQFNEENNVSAEQVISSTVELCSSTHSQRIAFQLNYGNEEQKKSRNNANVTRIKEFPRVIGKINHTQLQFHMSG